MSHFNMLNFMSHMDPIRNSTTSDDYYTQSAPFLTYFVVGSGVESELHVAISLEFEF